MVQVLFVCLGNICRSPMAEALFMDKVRKAGLQGEIEADSAGTGHWHVGEPPHPGTRKVLQSRGVTYTGRARLLTRKDLARFDYIIAMDRQNLRDVHELDQPSLDLSEEGQEERVQTSSPRKATLMSYAPELGYDEVPDPYYTGRFEEVYRLIDAACDGLLETIRREKGI